MGETRWGLETRLKEHQDACEKRMMEKSATVEQVWENQPPDSLGGDSSTGPRQRTVAVGEGGPTHPDDALEGVLQPEWTTGNTWLLDCCDEEPATINSCQPFTSNDMYPHGYKRLCLFTLSP